MGNLTETANRLIREARQREIQAEADAKRHATWAPGKAKRRRADAAKARLL